LTVQICLFASYFVTMVKLLVGALFAKTVAAVDWSSLSDGLTAWEAFKFDSNFTYEVLSGKQVVYKYPIKFTAEPIDATVEPTIQIAGVKNDLLRAVTSPHVSAILAGKDAGSTSGSQSVSRRDILTKGGGLTLPQLIQATGAKPTKGDEWQLLRDGIDAWANLNWDVDFTVNVGDKDGTLFTYTKGETDMHRRLPGASLSKWPAALTISGLVADGTLSFDDKVNKYLDFWSKDPKDSRSDVTLRNLLTFQSGYTSDASVSCAYDSGADFMSCVKDLYNASQHTTAPGKTFAYISTHLQFAGAMAVAASGLTPTELFKKYLYEPVGMTSTTWTPTANPQFATGITTTGADFEKMLQKLLTREFLGKTILDEVEKDWGAEVSPGGDGWFGHYAMGHWYDCIDYSAGQQLGSYAPLTEWCLGENIPSGPGAYGYYPLVDRKRGYYFQIVLAEDMQCRSEIPEYLRVIAKPLVDSIIQGSPSDDQTMLNSEGGLLLREIFDIYNYVPPQCNPSTIV